MKRAAHTLGGASSDPDHKDGSVKAARIARECLRDGKTALGAVVKSIEMIEKDPRFNAGTGSAIREDGKTVQMDAACM
jgi:isoaspartyl peptidase/L-asparaginase-like protein (Ntn-hydrolase superfamily)